MFVVSFLMFISINAYSQTPEYQKLYDVLSSLDTSWRAVLESNDSTTRELAKYLTYTIPDSIGIYADKITIDKDMGEFLTVNTVKVARSMRQFLSIAIGEMTDGGKNLQETELLMVNDYLASKQPGMKRVMVLSNGNTRDQDIVEKAADDKVLEMSSMLYGIYKALHKNKNIEMYTKDMMDVFLYNVNNDVKKPLPTIDNYINETTQSAKSVKDKITESIPKAHDDSIATSQKNYNCILPILSNATEVYYKGANQDPDIREYLAKLIPNSPKLLAVLKRYNTNEEIIEFISTHHTECVYGLRIFLFQDVLRELKSKGRKQVDYLSVIFCIEDSTKYKIINSDAGLPDGVDIRLQPEYIAWKLLQNGGIKKYVEMIFDYFYEYSQGAPGAPVSNKRTDIFEIL
jgi:hypothetical protein